MGASAEKHGARDRRKVAQVDCNGRPQDVEYSRRASIIYSKT